MPKLSPLRAALLAASLGLMSAPALAAPKSAGLFKDWTVYTDTIDGKKVCFASTPANDKAPRAVKHGDVFFYITRFEGERRMQPSLRTGLALKPTLAPRLSVGRSRWTLFAVGPEAFAPDSDDAAIVKAVKAGSELRAEATSEAGEALAYHFSLSGSTAAVEKAEALCR
jgi:invasion protein IalB